MLYGDVCCLLTVSRLSVAPDQVQRSSSKQPSTVSALPSVLQTPVSPGRQKYSKVPMRLMPREQIFHTQGLRAGPSSSSALP